jgi:predicted transcriptional regulator
MDEGPLKWHNVGMKRAKAMTIRLSADQAEELETVALVDDQPISEVIRAAISAHIRTRRSDLEFQQGLRSRIEHAQRMLSADDYR